MNILIKNVLSNAYFDDKNFPLREFILTIWIEKQPFWNKGLGIVFSLNSISRDEIEMSKYEKVITIIKIGMVWILKVKLLYNNLRGAKLSTQKIC